MSLPSSDPGSPAVERPDLMRTVSRVRPYTMLPDDFLVHLARQVEAVLAYDIPGDFVECGVWRGGAAFLIADILRATGASDRRVWLFDSFEGLPPPEEIDGPAALAWAAETESAGYHDNARVRPEEVREAASQLGR
ncbi:MAG TPA: TylF/MycF/NovP-related O-methyltransferase [Thermoleophilaceae bacterium]|nr:TylF/MycF/NovP-related O-methyltransferase [Thermoleophilaceae bacterium]